MLLFFGLSGDGDKPKPICPGGHLLSTTYYLYTVGYKPIATMWAWFFASSFQLSALSLFRSVISSAAGGEKKSDTSK